MPLASNYNSSGINRSDNVNRNIQSNQSSVPPTPSKNYPFSSNTNNNSNNNSQNNTGPISASVAISAHFEELKRELTSFSTLYQEWLDGRRRPLVEDKEMFLRSLSEEQEITAALKKQYDQLVELKKKIKDDIEREQTEYEEICVANADLHYQHQQQLKRLDELKTEAATLQTDMEKEKAAYQQALAEHEAELTRKQRKLALYQSLLGLSIDTIKVTMDVGGDLYMASDCSPPLPELPTLVANLNDSRDFYAFIKQVRQKFKQSVIA